MIDYKIGVRIAMASNGPEVLSQLMGALTGVHANAQKLEGMLGKVQRAALGAIGAFAGFKAIEGIWHVIEASKQLNQEMERTKQLGGDFAANLDRTRDLAFRTAQSVPTTTIAGNVRLAREIGTTIGHPDQVGALLPQAAMTAEVVSHYTGEAVDQIIKNLVRVADQRGQIYARGPGGEEHVDPAKLAAEFDAAAKGLILGGGFLKSNDLVQFARQGGAAAKQQTPEAFFAAGVEAAIAMGAFRAGTAETGLMQQFVGGTMSKAVMSRLLDAGLYSDDDFDWKEVRHGKGQPVTREIKSIRPEASHRADGIMQDPVAWLTTGEGAKTVKTYAAREGMDTMMAIFQLFGRQTVQRLVSEVTSNEPQFARARSIYGQIPDVASQYKELSRADLETNIRGLTAAWQSFLQVLGDAGIPAAIVALHGMKDAIHVMTAAIEAHPLIAGALLDLAAAVAALTALGGGIAVLTVAWAPLVAGVSTLVGLGSAMGIAATALSGLVAGIGGLTAWAATGGSEWVAKHLPDLNGSISGRGPSSLSNAPVGEGAREWMHRLLGLGPTHYQSVHPNGPNSLSMTGTVNLDGHAVGSFIGRQTDRAISATVMPDLRASPYGASYGAAP